MKQPAGRSLLSLNGVDHYLDMLLSLGKASNIKLDVNLSNLNDGKNPAHVVTFDPVLTSEEDHPIILLKQGKKFTVLTGQKAILEVINNHGSVARGARLISTVTMKKARVPQPVQDQPEVQEPRFVQPPVSDFFNRPRFSDTRTEHKTSKTYK